jgi:protein SCO1
MAAPNKRFILPVIAFGLGLVALAVAAFVMLSPEQGTTRSAIGGPFELTTHDGRVITDAQLKGRPALIFFGFTHCPDVCPTALYELTEVFKKLGPDAKIAAYFVTVDPERDTPAVMKDYVSNFDKRITGLSGDAAKTDAIMKAYRVYAKKVPGTNGDYTMDHTAIVYLMDKQGRFINAFNLSQAPEAAAKELQKYL